MSERTREIVLAELKAVIAEITKLVDDMPDAGGFQGAAVLYHRKDLRKKLEKLSKEAEKLGIKPEEVTTKP